MCVPVFLGTLVSMSFCGFLISCVHDCAFAFCPLDQLGSLSIFESKCNVSHFDFSFLTFLLFLSIILSACAVMSTFMGLPACTMLMCVSAFVHLPCVFFISLVLYLSLCTCIQPLFACNSSFHAFSHSPVFFFLELSFRNNLFVCICVCMCACMCIYLHACVHISSLLSIFLSLSMSVSVCLQDAFVYILIFILFFSFHLSHACNTHAYTHTYTFA